MPSKRVYLSTGKDWLTVSPCDLLTGYRSTRSVFLLPCDISRSGAVQQQWIHVRRLQVYIDSLLPKRLV